MELVRRLDIVDQLGRVESPTLVSVGMLDPVTPVAAAEEVVDALPEGIGQLEVIEGAGHWARKDAPDRFWPIIIEFIDSATIREPPTRKPSAHLPASEAVCHQIEES